MVEIYVVIVRNVPQEKIWFVEAKKNDLKYLKYVLKLFPGSRHHIIDIKVIILYKHFFLEAQPRGLYIENNHWNS